ncbi:unnamed protein product [Medioppia subpectinata]|uniref:CUT domain-containing protein n=1 Tax=Medioppia subpectinata TaxID=1979941 RepID=A0A7R9KPN8_9ACAR|nr:unnamed protein product [Medioppia subpectinata]CAG2106372.1 unnamed protein product [Medioppia subpectinata]
MMENMGSELADQQMGGGSSHASADDNHSESSGVPTVDNIDAVESVDSVGSGVDPPELLPAHEIADEIAATRADSTDADVDDIDEDGDNCEPDVSDEVTVAESTGMIDASDFRGVLSEPTYQTLNGRMTPPGFTTSSSYATLTPLQPLPPISTMSDKFTHHYGHPGNGGFTLMHMQNASLGMNANQYQYDKLGTAMAAAGMNMSNMSPTLGVATGHHHHHHHHHVINTNGNIHSHSSAIPSPPYHSNGLHSPDKSLSPTNGYDYTLRQGSPQSPSSVNLHSPTSLMPALNGLPTSPPSSHIPSPPPAQVSQMSSVPITVSGVLTSVTAPQQFTHNTQHLKVATTLTAAPQPITVLQAVTPTPAAIAPTGQTVTIVQAATSGISHLAQAIVSTPVAVVTTANALHQQQQQLNQIKQQHQHIVTIGGANGSKHANSQTNQQVIQTQTQTSSSASNNGADDIEEINTKDLAQRISAELKRYSIPQAIFAQRVLCRSQGTLSDLLRNPKPWSKLKSGRETFRRMQKWLEEPEFQRMSALRLAV